MYLSLIKSEVLFKGKSKQFVRKTYKTDEDTEQSVNDKNTQIKVISTWENTETKDNSVNIAGNIGTKLNIRI